MWGLTLMHDLKTVLDHPQKPVGAVQVVVHGGFDDPCILERGQRREGGGRPQRRVLGTVGQLEHLREQLDLPDAAVAHLDVPVAVAGLFGAPLVTGDFIERGVVEILAIDERPDEVKKRLPQRVVPRDRPRLDQRESLEGFTLRLVVVRVLPQRAGNIALTSHRAQTQVDPIQIALGGVVAERLREPPRQSVEELVVRRCVGVGWLVDIDQVDVGAVVQLPATQFAHADHREAARNGVAPGCHAEVLPQ